LRSSTSSYFRWQKSHFKSSTVLWTDKLCFFKEHFSVNFVEQMLHSKPLVFWWTLLRCRSYSAVDRNVTGQSLHSTFLIFSCTTSWCLFRWLFLAKLFVQSLQSKGFTFSWTARTCLCSIALWRNWEPHWLQFKVGPFEVLDMITKQILEMFWSEMNESSWKISFM
jgi:hypothetical protein